MDALVEMHSARRAASAPLALGARVVGVNARDLDDARDRPRPAARAAGVAAARRSCASPSRASRRARTSRRARDAGADALLVGTALMRDPALLAELVGVPRADRWSRSAGSRAPRTSTAAVEAGADMVGFVLVRVQPALASSSTARRALRGPRPGRRAHRRRGRTTSEPARHTGDSRDGFDLRPAVRPVAARTSRDTIVGDPRRARPAGAARRACRCCSTCPAGRRPTPTTLHAHWRGPRGVRAAGDPGGQPRSRTTSREAVRARPAVGRRQRARRRERAPGIKDHDRVRARSSANAKEAA